MALTITEALAEVKMIGKRIAKKDEFIRTFLARQDQLKDPLESQGGSRAAIAAERQGIADLEARIIALRVAIARANDTTTLTINGTTRTIVEWLHWRREVAPGRQARLQGLRNSVNQLRTQAQQKGLALRSDGSSAAAPTDVIVNIDERELQTETEAMETTLGILDGQLSLKNATTFVSV